MLFKTQIIKAKNYSLLKPVTNRYITQAVFQIQQSNCTTKSVASQCYGTIRNLHNVLLKSLFTEKQSFSIRKRKD